MDAHVARAGVRDAGAYPIPQYPWLRTDRFLASFRDEVADDARFAAWLERLRARDREARAAELRNLDVPDAPALRRHLDRCGQRLNHALLAGGDRAALRAAAKAPDEYSTLARALGLYVLAVPFLNLGISGYHEEVREDYAKPLLLLEAPGTLWLWRPPPGGRGATPALRRAPRDALGIPRIGDQLWQELARAHAPAWWIETTGEYDRPGAPVFAGGEPTVDAGRPVAYFDGGFTRLGTRVLATITYTLWFRERPAEGAVDPYAGALDGLVWRVTLDPDGKPLVYDTIHPCGCFRYFFPAQPLQRREAGGFWQEQALFPQPQVPDPPLALRVATRTHYLRRVVTPAQVEADRRSRYRLEPYANLLSLPDGARRRSLFGEDGTVAGSQRLERWWLWVSGVPSPGAMRQSGRHATAFVGRAHFDDARFLEDNFALPDWAR